MRYDFIIVGSGITGSTVARVLAEMGKKVLVVDRRNHIGGNCFDEYDEQGILIHKYGPHIFHTSHREVWDFLSRFTEWRPYQHKVRVYLGGKTFPFPINVDTINQIYNLTLEADQMEDYLEKVRVKIDVVANSRDSVISRVGTDLYEKFFKNYTFKQWGVFADKLEPYVCERIPIRFDRDDRYFTDTYQGMPLHGYRKLFEKMLDHANIGILLQTDFADIKEQLAYTGLIYTGQIDEFFNYRYGKLGYRSLRFDFQNMAAPSFQEVAVVNYPNDYDYTRITEYKKLTGQRTESTTVSYEFPCNEGDPYYPMPTSENHCLYEKYALDARNLKNVTFAGRLGAYRYLNMDAACLEGIKVARGVLP